MCKRYRVFTSKDSNIVQLCKQISALVVYVQHVASFVDFQNYDKSELQYNSSGFRCVTEIIRTEIWSSCFSVGKYIRTHRVGSKPETDKFVMMSRGQSLKVLPN